MLRKHLRLLSAVAVAVIVVVGITSHRVKADTTSLTIWGLAGNWRMSFAGITGCGYGTQVSDIVLSSTGVGTIGAGNSKYHTAGCGDGVTTIPTEFVVQTLNSDGTGTGNLSCGPGCGWNLLLQVSHNGEVISFTDVDPVNPGNFVSGTIVKKTSNE
jgi:hypothetical protein